MSALYPDCDPYGIADRLTEAERAPILRLRTVLENEITPLVAEYWEKGEFPYQIAPSLYGLNLMTPDEIEGAPRSLYHGFRIFELARTDASMATFYTAQAGLFRTTCRVGASPEQFAELDPKITSFETIGVFCLTEPDHGSDSVSLETSARKEGNQWVINGHKRWIGNGHAANVIVLYARDEADGQVKAFVVEKQDNGEYPEGYRPEVIKGKIAKRAINQADIVIENLKIPDENRLPNCNSFKDVNLVLKATRGGASWEALGHGMAAFEIAARYALDREQFGAPIGSFQLVQEKLATMLSDLTAMQLMCTRMAHLAENDQLTDAMASMVKMFTSRKALDMCRTARDMLAGNGILLENHIGRHLTDMEVVSTYEGTDSMQALIVGREITGISAFTRKRK